MSDDIIEQMARAQYQELLDNLRLYGAFPPSWEEKSPEAKKVMLSQSRAAYAIARRATLEEAAKFIEQRTAMKRTLFALNNGLGGPQSCEHAAAIRKMAGEE